MLIKENEACNRFTSIVYKTPKHVWISDPDILFSLNKLVLLQGINTKVEELRRTGLRLLRIQAEVNLQVIYSLYRNVQEALEKS